MPGKVEALGILLVLLPGLLCSYIVQNCASRRPQSELDKAVEALIFSLVIYLPTLPFINYTLPVTWNEIPGNGTYRIAIRYIHLLALALTSVVIGLLYSASINHDWLLSLGRKLRITQRTARKDIWNDIFHEHGGWVQVGLTGDVVVNGWLSSYSDDAEESSLFLEQAGWVDKDGSEHPIEGPGVLITKSVGIEYVAFLNARKAGDQL